MTHPLKILIVAAEATPFIKTGGLADVAQALPGALHRQGHDVRLALPCYGSIPASLKGTQRGTLFVNLDGTTQYGAWRETRLPDVDVPVYLIENDHYFWRDHPYSVNGYEYVDNLDRFCFFSRGVLDAVAQTGWRPDVVHGNDWHTAPLITYLNTHLANHTFWRGMPTVYTIHNLGYQGCYPKNLLPRTGLGWDLFHPDCLEFYGELNLMKGAIAFATKINTVSRTYAREIQTPAYGLGLDGFLRTRKKDLTGIKNGIDYSLWNPQTDPHITANYSPDKLAGKQRCKRAVQDLADLPHRKDVPLFAIVTRLVWEKGIDLIVEAMDSFLRKGAQLVALGSGDPHLEVALETAGARWPDQVSVILGYDEPLAHSIYAGADFFIMPSRSEPCGLTQMYSLAYGAIPIVRRTGGLADTVTDLTPANLAKGLATGLVFRPATAEALTRATHRALRLYEDLKTLTAMRRAGMREDLSWERASAEYVALYNDAIDATKKRYAATVDPAKW